MTQASVPGTIGARKLSIAVDRTQRERLLAVDFRGSGFDDRRHMPVKLPSVPRRSRYAVILAGGSGTRFWPWSRGARPKQLLPLCGERSMLSDTVARISRIVPRKNIIVVPVNPYDVRSSATSRGSAAIRSSASRSVGTPLRASRGPHSRSLGGIRDATMVVLPADHVVVPVAVVSRRHAARH